MSSDTRSLTFQLQPMISSLIYVIVMMICCAGIHFSLTIASDCTGAHVKALGDGEEEVRYGDSWMARFVGSVSRAKIGDLPLPNLKRCMAWNG